MINYHCPNFYTNFFVFQVILKLKKEYPECLIDNVNIGSVYGCFPGVIWNGGGTQSQERVNLETMVQMLTFYQDANLPVKLTLTNPVLDNLDCLDKYSNSILQLCSNFNNVEILVSSPLLENHLNRFYPNFTLSQSIIATTANNKNLEEYLQDCEKYHHIVLPRRLVKNKEFLSSIPIEYRHKFELLCTDPCPVDCPRLSEHYYDFGRVQVGSVLSEDSLPCSNPAICNTIFKSVIFKEHQISLNEIKEYYEPEQFTEFKISGRGSIRGILNMVPMIFKPEYHTEIYNLLITNYVEQNGSII